MKPNFLIIGSPKCGTTTLWHALSQHPQVFMTQEKEPSFFSHHYDRGWAWYESLFAQSKDAKAIGEASPAYTAFGYGDDVAQRISQDLPGVRVIYLMRHPMRKIESEWMQARKQSRRGVSRDFNQSVLNDAFVLGSVNYRQNMERYHRYLGADRMHVICLEDFKADPLSELCRCCRFLEIDETEAAQITLASQNVAAQQRVDTRAATWLRRHALARYTADRMPDSWGSLAQRLLKRPIHGRPQWEPSVYARAVEQVREEAWAALELAGKSTDYWDLSPVSDQAAA